MLILALVPLASVSSIHADGLVGDSALLAAEGTPTEGQPLEIRGSGFSSQQWVQLTWDASTKNMPSTRTSRQGSFTTSVEPSGLGSHVLAAVSTSKGSRKGAGTTGEVLASLTLEVREAGSFTPELTPSPTETPIANPTASPTGTPIANPTASPTSNATCSAEVHDRYMVTGPDGKLYHGWHPQHDPKTGCYFNHEHGSNPALFAAADKYQPAFGYVGAASGFPEPHAGYKNFLVDDGQGYHWLFTVHIGTAGAGRACNRFHGMDVAVARISTGELLARVHFMGDFGRAEDNKSLLPLSPDACPTQYQNALSDGSKGIRQLSVDTVGEGQYEPWRVDTLRTITGFFGSGLLFNTLSAMTTCDGLTCNSVYPTGHPGAGAWRMLDYAFAPGTEVDGMRFVAGLNTGNFTTDGFARTLNGPVMQYVNPGIDVRAPAKTKLEKFWPTTPSELLYRMSEKSPITAFSCNIDGMLRPPN